MKKFTKIEKETSNPYLNLYHMEAMDREENAFDYYYVSRREEKNLRVVTKDLIPEGIVIYAVTKEKHPRLVLIREYRYPLGDYIYAMPAGLIDEGETPGAAAKREIREETGLNFEEYKEGKEYYRKPFFIAPGFSDEANCAVFGTVENQMQSQQCEVSDRIEVILADKEMVQKILMEEKVSLRGAYLMFLYLNDAGNGLSFLY